MIRVLRFLLIVFYFLAGCYHFINPNFYRGLIPDYLPYPSLINYMSGALEIILAIGVAYPKTRIWSVKGIILLLVAFIPSHLYFIQMGSCVETAFCVSPWVAWIRLVVIHPLFLLWAWSIRKTP